MDEMNKAREAIAKMWRIAFEDGACPVPGVKCNVDRDCACCIADAILNLPMVGIIAEDQHVDNPIAGHYPSEFVRGQHNGFTMGVKLLKQQGFKRIVEADNE